MDAYVRWWQLVAVAVWLIICWCVGKGLGYLFSEYTHPILWGKTIYRHIKGRPDYVVIPPGQRKDSWD
jgi:hypothetical protein